MELTPYPWLQGQWQRFLSAVGRDRVPHALLLAGPAGTGIGEFATCMAARLLCEQPLAQGIACGVCRACTLFAAGSHPDLLRVEADPRSGQVRIESVREVIQFLQLSTHYRRHKVALVSAADAMNRAAANSLLKILEEPPPESVLILCANRPGALPVTIRSRCQRILFHSEQGAEAARWLSAALGVDGDRAAELLRRSRGAPLRALAAAQEDEPDRSAELAEDLVRLRDRKVNPVRVAQKWSGYGAAEVMERTAAILAEAARLKVEPGRSPGAGHLQRMADDLDLAELVACFDAAMKGYRSAAGPFNLNSQSLIEEFIARWQDPTIRSRGEAS